MPQSNPSQFSKPLGYLKSIFSTVPDAAALSVGLANAAKQLAEKHGLEEELAWGVFGATMLVGVPIGVWFKHTFYGKNFVATTETVVSTAPNERTFLAASINVSDSESREKLSFRQYLYKTFPANFAAFLWSAYEAADAFLAAQSQGSQGYMKLAQEILLPLGKFMQTMLVQRGAVVGDSRFELPDAFYSVNDKLGRLVYELSPMLMNYLHVKATNTYVELVAQQCNFVITAPMKFAIYAFAFLTMGQASAYINVFYDNLTGAVNSSSHPEKGLPLVFNWDQSKREKGVLASWKSILRFVLSFLQTGQGLAQGILNPLMSLCNVSDDRKQKVKYGFYFAGMTVGLGALFACSAIQFCKENYKDFYAKHTKEIVGALSFLMFGSAAMITKAKLGKAMENEFNYYSDPRAGIFAVIGPENDGTQTLATRTPSFDDYHPVV